MNASPKITVVTPCFNMVKYIELTIASVLNQNYPNLEYIIIDGGSTDGSVEIIKKYADKLSYWISEPDSGMYDAIQKGFEKSSGEIMCWLNADDIFLPNALYTVAKLFNKHAKVSWIEGNNVICEENNALINSHLPESHTRYNFLRNKHLNTRQEKILSFGTVQQESTFWRRSLWEKAGGALKTSLKLGGDFELWIRFFRFTDLYVTSALLSAFRVRPDQNSVQNRQAYIEEIKAVIAEEQKLLTNEDKKIIHFLNRAEKIPFILKSGKIRRKYLHYTRNILIQV